MALTLVWQLPTIIWVSPTMGGQSVSLRISPNVIESLVALVVSLAVTDSIIQVHPILSHLSIWRRVRGWWQVYSLPAALAIVVVVAQPLAAPPAVSAVAMLAAIAAYVTTQFLLYEALDPEHPHHGQFVFFLHGIAYVTAFLLFLLVYQTKGRLLIAVPLIAGTAFLLAIELLRTVAPSQRAVLRHALLVGVVMAEVELALTLVPITELASGVLLIWSFFLLINVFQNRWQRKLNRRQFLEYGFFTVLVVWLIVMIESEGLGRLLAVTA